MGAAVVADTTMFYTTADQTATAVLTPSATTSVNMSTLMMLDDGALEDYYFYDGSLTAPADDAVNNAAAHSCAEIVRWIIPTQRLTMTAAEMAAFNLNTNWGDATFGTNSRTTQTGARIAGITVNHRVKPVA